MSVILKELKKLTDEVWWIGKFIYEYFFNYLNHLNLTEIRSIKILTSYANITKDFKNYYSAFLSIHSEEPKKIDVKVFPPEETDNETIHIFDNKTGIKTVDLENFEELNKKDIVNLKKRYEKATALDTDWNEILRKRIETTYKISSRRLPTKVKDEIFEAILLFEKVNDSTGALKLVEIYEKYIRGFIKSRLSSYKPVNWYKNYVEPYLDKSQKGRITKRFKQDPFAKVSSIEKHRNPLEYFSCKDYSVIIEKIQEKVKYKKFFPDVKNLLTLMERIRELRNPASHYRETFEKDLILAVIWALEEINKIEGLEKLI